jgi:hypothetical protein
MSDKKRALMFKCSILLVMVLVFMVAMGVAVAIHPATSQPVAVGPVLKCTITTPSGNVVPVPCAPGIIKPNADWDG